MKKVKLFLSIAAFFLLISEVSAGTHYNAEITGYSGDGRYAALKIYGIEDGSGFYFHTIRFLDVFKNRFTGPAMSIKQTDDEDAAWIDDRVKRKAASGFRKYGISSSIKPIQLQLQGTELEKTFNYNNKHYTVKITETDSDIQCNSMAGPIPGKGFSIALNGRILDQAASPLGKSGCAFQYIIDSAFCYKGHVIIIYRALTPGFEGPDSSVLFSSSPLE